MYSNTSGINEITSKVRGNAFVQIVMEANVEVPAVLDVQLQPYSSTIPTDQVPVSRDTISSSIDDGVLSMMPSCSLEPCRNTATHIGCMPCALTERIQNEGGGAGPLIWSPLALSLSFTVITSSTHQESLSPSHTTHCGAIQSSSAKSVSHHHGSSSFSSNSLIEAQTQLETCHDFTKTQANMEERLYSGALLLQDDNNRINYSNKHSVKRSTTPHNIPSKPYQTLKLTVQGEQFTRKSFNYSNDYFTRWGIPKGCRLRGGGESSLAGSATGGWGNSNNNNNANSAAWSANGSNSGQQQPPSNTNPTQAQQPSQWANSNNNNPAPSQRPSTNSTSPQSQQNTGNSVMKVTGNQVNNSNGPQAMQQPSPAPVTQNQSQQQQSGNQSQGQQQNGSATWAQAAGKGLPPAANPTPSSGSSNTPATGTTGTTTKQQLEQLNTMREALFSQDGWGGEHVNQDSGWDIPSSPEPGTKDSNGAPIGPVWKPNVNNGTDLWEANLRNGGQPPPQVAQKAPWGHTPTSNIGGTWGEDDDLGDASNVWTGVPSGQSSGVGSQWGANSAGVSGGPQQPMWGGPKKETDWSGVGGGSNWGDSRDPRDMRGTVGNPIDPRTGNDIRSAMVDHRDPMRSVMDHSFDYRGMTGNDVMMRGDPRGISGRLNGSASDPMWGGPPQQPPHHHMPHHQQAQLPNKMVAPNTPGVNQWPGPPPKDMNMPVTKPTGWEEPSPPAQRRNIPNYDDGTSLWGSQQQRAAMQGNKVSHWKEMPTAAMGRGMQCPPGMQQNRMTPNASNNMKPDTPLWAHPIRNGSWGDGQHEVGGVTPWGDDKVGGSGGLTPWNNDPSLGPSWGGPKPKNSLNQTPWVDAEVDASTWGHPPKQQVPKPLTRELLWASKQFRILSEMGYKKDDIENALRGSNMVLEDAMEFLQNATRGLSVGDAWRGGRHSEMDPQFDHPNPQAFPSQRLNPQLPFAPPGGTGSGPNLLNNAGNQSLSNISPAIVQKILTQQPPPQQPAPYNQSRTPQNQPSAQQLRMLVQQIQMAVQAGYLNHQILNQPLAPQTLILLNQLLQQIKHLQMQQQMLQVQNPILGGGKAQISVQIAKAKQSIANLQNQIAAQQAIYMKQHPMPPHQGDFFKTNVPDPISALQTNFSDMGMNKDPQHPSFQSQQQSRLNQWKLPSLDKDGDITGGNEFSRAPGTTTKSQGGNSSPNLNPLLGQGDGTWSSVTRSNSDTGWPDSNSVETDNKDWPVASSQSNSQAFTDLVPEFEPGKPWKGTQIKSIEDDPSITPGSVVRSPLSLATIKDTEIFSSSGGGKTSPTVSGVDMPIPPLSLSSSTWSFNPPASTASSFSSPLSKLGVSKSTWEAPPPNTVSNELWSVPKSRGPPPGLSSKIASNPGSAGVTTNSNGWGSLGSRWGGSGGSVPQQNQSSWGSTWLLLKNLTPQIDGSTLKTLCVQHGPLSNFHLYLNHGIAVAKYSTRDEANKAQGALNNCVLSNTTIFAESLVDTEAQSLLQHLGQQSSGGGGWGLRGGSTPGQGSGPKGAPPGGDTWGSGSQLWAPPNSGGSSLWGPPPIDNSDQHRATPSSLNSFLPGDLLGSNDTM